MVQSLEGVFFFSFFFPQKTDDVTSFKGPEFNRGRCRMACSTRRTTNAPCSVARTVCLGAWACACRASRKHNLWAQRRRLCAMSSRGKERITGWLIGIRDPYVMVYYNPYILGFFDLSTMMPDPTLKQRY